MRSEKKFSNKTENIKDIQIKKIKQLFPEAVTEGKLDFKKLKASIGEDNISDDDSYGLNWSGKEDVFRIIQQQTTARLAPCEEDSIKFNESENVFIEGENLEVLKLLHKSYLDKIKLIYIDPPYNIDKGFVYDDDFSEGIESYLKKTGQMDEEGNYYSTEIETGGRFHSKWLTMMYPRLFMARQLLREDGAIIISIDDSEKHNLRIIMNEIFGEENFLLSGVVNRPSEIASNFTVSKHEYFVIYAKNINKLSLGDKKRYTISRGTVGNEDQTMPVIKFPAGLECKGIEDGVYESTRKVEGSKENIENLDPIIVQNGELAEDVRLKARWRSSNDMRNFFNNNCEPTEAKINGIIEEIYFDNDRFMPKIKKRITEKIPSLITDNKRGSKYLDELGFTSGIVDYPKCVNYIKKLIGYFVSDNDIVLDFFAGSCTTAQSVLEFNQEKDYNLQFIMIQLPEKPQKDSVASRSGYDSIAEIGKERIKRVIRKKEIKDGFKVFKLTSSVFSQWNTPDDENVEDLKKQMQLFDNMIKEDNSDTDILYEIMIKKGFGLNSRIITREIKNNCVYLIENDLTNLDDKLYICLDDQIDDGLINELGLEHDDLFICPDPSLTDQQKINFSLETTLEVI